MGQLEENQAQQVLVEFFAIVKALFFILSQGPLVRKANEAEILEILEKLRMYVDCYQEILILK